VTTIDEQTPKRGMVPSIVEGTSSRLRAVLLTTFTTVGGLAPLLFETSRQALFLKPTVVTLSFGLGFGVVLVLVITPAVMAVEHDIRMALKSLRNMWALPARNRRERARFGRYSADNHPVPAPQSREVPEEALAPATKAVVMREAARRAAE